MLLTGVVQNIGTGGTEDGDGRPDDRWPLLAERINSAAERARSSRNWTPALMCVRTFWSWSTVSYSAQPVRETLVPQE